MSSSSETDDLFANSSTETVVENIDFSLVLKQAHLFTNSVPTQSTHEEGAEIIKENGSNAEFEIVKKEVNRSTQENEVLDYLCDKVCNFPLKFFCPFCCNCETTENLLKEHLKVKHMHHLKSFDIHSLKSCSFCHAQFFTKDILTKHITQTHQETVILMFQKNLDTQNMVCLFCPYSVLPKHKQLLMKHVKNKHSVDFKKFVDEKYLHMTQNENSKLSTSNDNSSILDLNVLFMQLSTDEKEFSAIDSVCSKPKQPSLSRRNEDTKIGNELHTKRKLRFDTESQNSKYTNKENIISCSVNLKLINKCMPKLRQNKTSRWASTVLFKRKQVNGSNSVPSLVTSTPITMPFANKKSNSKKHTSQAMKKIVKTKAMKKTAKTKTLLVTKKENKCNLHQCVTTGDDDEHLKINNKNEKFCEVKQKEQPSNIFEVLKDSSCSLIPSEETFKQFKCAFCLEAFVNNFELLCHARQQHTGPMKLLQPPYKCGQCEAKFYKNSFLLRHCKFHHTPRCKNDH